MSIRRRFAPAGVAAALIVLTCIRIWLDAAVSLKAEDQSYDDALYARLALSILRGEWLGTFDHLTLCKSPGYPLWIAATHALGVPLLLGQSVLRAAAGLLAVMALRRVGLPRGFVVAVYALYLFDPFVEVRLLREGIYGSLLVLTVAASVALSARIRAGRPARWSALLVGVATSAAWLTREESVLVLPAVVVILAPAAWLALRNARGIRERAAMAGGLAMCPVVVLIAVGAVSVANLRAYGVFRVTDQDARPFARAFGAILSVEHARPIPYLQVPPDVRGRLYRASPSYASLGPYVDGVEGSISTRMDWRRVTCSFYPHICGDIGGSWAMWSFRLAVADAGHYRTAREADRFLEAVSNEVDAACSAGILACRERRTSVLPPLRPGDLSRIIYHVGHGAGWVLKVPVSRYVYDVSDRSQASPERARSFAELTGGPVRPTDASSPAEAASPSRELRLGLFRGLTTLYGAILEPLTALALALLVAWTIACAIKRKLPVLLLVAYALLAGFASRLVLLGYVHAMLFPAFGNWPSYITPLYPLLLLFVGVTLSGGTMEASAWWTASRATRATAERPQALSG